MALLQQTTLPPASDKTLSITHLTTHSGSSPFRCCPTALWEIQISNCSLQNHTWSSLCLPLQFTYYHSPMYTPHCKPMSTFFFLISTFLTPQSSSLLFHLRSFMVLVPTKNTHLYPKFQSRQHFLQDAFIPATISAFSTLLSAATPAQASHNITMTIIFVFLTLASSQREHGMCHVHLCPNGRSTT